MTLDVSPHSCCCQRNLPTGSIKLYCIVVTLNNLKKTTKKQQQQKPTKQNRSSPPLLRAPGLCWRTFLWFSIQSLCLKF